MLSKVLEETLKSGSKVDEQRKTLSSSKMETKAMKRKPTFKTISFRMRRDSWPACERLGMCCVEKGPSPLNHMPLKTPHHPTRPTPIPPTAHSSTLVLSVNAAGVPSTPPFAARPTTASPLTNTPDNWHQLRGWTQCVGRGRSAGLTPHLTPAWPLACDSSSLKAALPSTPMRPVSISSPHVHGSQARHTPSGDDVAESLRSIQFKLRINDF